LYSLNQNIWDRIKEGDEKAFELLFNNIYPGLCYYAYRLIPNRELSEELVQDVLLKIWQNRNQLILRGTIQSYLYQSVHNQSINAIKQHATHKFRVHQLTGEATWKFIEDTYSIDDFLIEHMEAEETEGLINQTISTLPSQCREIFQLSRFEGKSTDEIASQFGITENSVRTQLYRALRKIKEALEKS
jgi:RNA polymerase sigma-70 factor, ECF subfamily